MRWRRALALITVLAAACGETGQDRTSVPLFVAGTNVSEPVVAAFDVPVTIDRADLAFGPLYLCAGATAGDLCDTARLEWLAAVVVDTTVSVPTRAGELSGVTGPIRSWMYDLGISSQLTRTEPFILDAASALGGTSFVLEGRAVVDGITLPFEASVPIQQTTETELGVPVVRKSTSETFFRDVGPDESALLVTFDPWAWIRNIDFRRYVSRESCTSDGPALVCDGALARSCDGERELSTRDCAGMGRVCIPETGCKERLTIDDESEAYRSVRNALMSGGRPSFNWDYVP